MIKYILLTYFTFLICNVAFAQAKIFEPKRISNNEAFGLTVAPNGQELFYVNSYGGRDTLQIFQSKKGNGAWQQPTLAFFADTKVKQIDPSVSPDGNTILYNAVTSAENSFDVYAVYKTKNGWSNPERLSDAINSKAGDFYATMSLNKNIYFTRREQSNDIYVSYFVNNQYQKAIPLDSTINTALQESNPYISPKEDYIIYFSDKKGGYGDVDLYISFKKKNKWSYPMNLGDKVNTAIGEFCPSVDIKNNIFYFSRTEEQHGRRVENIYQIDLKELNLKKLKKTAKYN